MLLGPTHRSEGRVYFAWRYPELKFLHFKKNNDIFIFINICWTPHFERSPRRFTIATDIALFSVSRLTHSALVVSDSEWVTVALHSAFWISTEVVTEWKNRQESAFDQPDYNWQGSNRRGHDFSASIRL